MRYLFILCLLCCMACTSIHYTTKDGEKITEVNYSRVLGWQNVKDFEVEIIGTDGMKKTVKFDSSRGDNSQILDVIKELLIRIPVVP